MTAKPNVHDRRATGRDASRWLTSVGPAKRMAVASLAVLLVATLATGVGATEPVPIDIPVGSGPVKLIVGLSDTSWKTVGEVQRGVNDLAEVTGTVRGVDAVGVTVDAADAQGVARLLQNTPGVTYVEPEHQYRAFGNVTPDDYWFSSQAESLQLRLPEAWATTKGSSTTVVGVLDSGVTPNNDLVNADGSSAVIAGYDFVNNDSNPADDDGHGTSVATVLAGRGNNSFGIAGVCWRCQVLPVKVLDSAGLGTTSQIAAGITYAVDHGATILNLSLGGPNSSATLDAAVSYAIDRNVIVVGAAGNEGASTEFPLATAPQYPAASPGVLSVGSVTIGSINVYPGASRGPWVDVAAPNQVVTFGVSNETAYYFSGTSAATPMVSGTLALMAAAHPERSAATLQEGLIATARAIAPEGVIAGGLVDAAAAVAWDPPVNPTTTTSAPPSTSWVPPTTSPPDLPPSVTLDPLPAWISGAWRFWATATDDRAVLAVDLALAGSAVRMSPGGGNRWYVDVNTPSFGQGAASASAVAVDTSGQRSRSTVLTVGLDNVAPAALVWGPDGATVTGSVTVILGATDSGSGTKATLLVADGRFVGGLTGDGGTFVTIPITRNGSFGIAAITVDNVGNAAFSNLITVNGRTAVVAGKRISRRR